ncbi:hypothetical protein LUZ60_004569 [Juncus effusus]|nr:hypothetical protein LUZ60_004569 [Juncus effusus]
MAIVAPIAVFWLYSGFYMLMRPIKRYRLHTEQEEEEKNTVDLPTVVKGMLFQQFLQILVAQLMYLVRPVGPIHQPPIFIQILQIIIAMLVLDTWQYFVHRYLHTNMYLYRTLHLDHHKLIAPYAVGALYNQPLDGIIVVTLGGAVAFLVSGMTARTSIYFFCFTMAKTVDDHSGIWLPWNIFHLFENNCAFHDIHHSLRGLKCNFSGPFFTFWDKVMGTYVPYQLVRREDGTLESRPLKLD